jgi:hypothetical protein
MTFESQGNKRKLYDSKEYKTHTAKKKIKYAKAE